MLHELCRGPGGKSPGPFAVPEVLVGRLKSLPARIGTVSQRLGAPVVAEERSARRDASVHWRKWYKTKQWQRLRWQVLVRDLFTCRMCGELKAKTSELVADHAVPHRGDEALFWDERNLQTLCKPCHDGAKQAAERRGNW